MTKDSLSALFDAAETGTELLEILNDITSGEVESILEDWVLNVNNRGLIAPLSSSNVPVEWLSTKSAEGVPDGVS